MKALSKVFHGHDVRVVVIDGAFYAVAADVAKALNYSKTYHLTRLVKDKYKGPRIVGTLGGDQEMTCISEPGLWQTLGTMRKAEAEPFQDWLWEEVLPEIRKTGSYNTKEVELGRTFLRIDEQRVPLFRTADNVFARGEDVGEGAGYDWDGIDTINHIPDTLYTDAYELNIDTFAEPGWMDKDVWLSYGGVNYWLSRAVSKETAKQFLVKLMPGMTRQMKSLRHAPHPTEERLRAMQQEVASLKETVTQNAMNGQTREAFWDWDEGKLRNRINSVVGGSENAGRDYTRLYVATEARYGWDPMTLKAEQSADSALQAMNQEQLSKTYNVVLDQFIY